MKTITDTGIKSTGRNGAWEQTVIFKNSNNTKFRICIRSESYTFQSYARLESWTTDKGFKNIISHNPNDYGIDVSYQKNVTADTFKPIITALKKIAKDF